MLLLAGIIFRSDRNGLDLQEKFGVRQPGDNQHGNKRRAGPVAHMR
jgi:hypothetical protein